MHNDELDDVLYPLDPKQLEIGRRRHEDGLIEDLADGASA